jgi:hypothetical protein
MSCGRQRRLWIRLCTQVRFRAMDGTKKCSLCLDTGLPVFLPFRMSSFVLSNLVVTAGMLTPGLGVS